MCVGVVGRATIGPDAGRYVEVDDDSTRQGGTGGYYVLVWDSAVAFDEWYETEDGVREALAERGVSWLTQEESSVIPGRHRHGTST